VNLPSLSGRTSEASPVAGARTPTLPRVNLLPPEIHEAARFRRFQLAMVGAGVGAVAVVAALAFNAHSGVNSAKADLATANNQHAALQTQVNGLQSVADVYSQVAAKKAMLSHAMGPEIRWSFYLTDLSLKIPQNVWLTNLTATEQATGAAPTTAAASLVPAGIGSITVTGQAFSHDDVATWLAQLTAASLVRVYEVAGQTYGELTGWERHQRIDNRLAVVLATEPAPIKRLRCTAHAPDANY